MNLKQKAQSIADKDIKIGLKLRLLMVLHGLDNSDIAFVLGISDNEVEKIILHQREVSPELEEKIIEELI